MTVICHVDMDAFYVAVELRRRPDLRGKPVWVGGATRGVVLSASYEARAYGVEGGMSSTRARRLCPDAIAITPDYDAYEAASQGVFAIFSTITPSVERVSLDEGFLDITGTRRLLGEPEQVGELIRALVADEQGIPCSVGIAPSKLIAKMASNRAKPDGLVRVQPGEVIPFLHPLAVEKVWGIGPATTAALRAAHQPCAVATSSARLGVGIVGAAMVRKSPASSGVRFCSLMAWPHIPTAVSDGP